MSSRVYKLQSPAGTSDCSETKITISQLFSVVHTIVFWFIQLYVLSHLNDNTVNELEVVHSSISITKT